MRFGLLIPQSGPPEVLLGRCIEAERLGFESVWIGDHFYLEALHFELLEAMTVLGAIAVSVPRVRFGAMTTSAIYRNPAVVAKQAASLDVLSGGRFEIALGAGVYDADHRMTGSRPWAPRERVDRFAEFVDIVDRLLRGDAVNGGPYYPVEGAIVTPRPVQQPRPPLTIGANGRRMIRLAAERADRWNTWGGRGLAADELWSVTEARTRAFDGAVEAAGRDRRSVTRSLYVYRPIEPWSSVDAFREIVGRGRSIGLDELLFAWPGFLQESGAQAQLEVMRRVAADVLPDEMGAGVDAAVGVPASGGISHVPASQ